MESRSIAKRLAVVFGILFAVALLIRGNMGIGAMEAAWLAVGISGCYTLYGWCVLDEIKSALEQKIARLEERLATED